MVGDDFKIIRVSPPLRHSQEMIEEVTVIEGRGGQKRATG
jgi:hypothetical protein